MAQQRLVFLVKPVSSWLRQEFTPKSVITEVLKLLTAVLPRLADIYGSHWSDALTFLAEMWPKTTSITDEQLPAIHASLRLYAILKALVRGDANDDLVDAWQDSKETLSKGLINLLRQAQSKSPDVRKPSHLGYIQSQHCGLR